MVCRGARGACALDPPAVGVWYPVYLSSYRALIRAGEVVPFFFVVKKNAADDGDGVRMRQGGSDR